LPLVDWRVTDDLRFSVIASADPGLLATYRASERLDLYARLQLDERQFRLKDQNTLQDAVVVDSEVSGIAGLVWHARGLDVELFGGLADRNMEIDADGEELVDDGVEVAAVFGASLTWIF
jgi:hypothetical protein